MLARCAEGESAMTGTKKTSAKHARLSTAKDKAGSQNSSALPPSRKFAAIDFETADHGRDSACALSIVLSENSRIVEKKAFLIRPPRKEFVFTYLHGISWNDVRIQPSFGELWEEKIAPLLDEVDFIAAHNATFDRSVLYESCNFSGFNPPEAGFVCTVKLARHVWNIFPTKLPDVCSRLKIDLKHHDASSDAHACAQIVLSAMKHGFDPLKFIDRRI
jgi:DNA polymerase III subunit epsilon